MPKATPAKKTLTLNQEPESVIYARKAAKLRQREAASRLKISPQLLNDIEHGRRNATRETLTKMTVVYGCPEGVLLRKRWVAA